MNQPILSVRDLRVSYRSRGELSEVVHGVSFDVAAGETVAVVGESGSGKSTVAHAILGLLPANGEVGGGSVMLNGVDISRWSQRRLSAVRGARIGLVPQDPGGSLNPVRTIGSQLGEIFRIHKRGRPDEARRNVIELLARVGLSDPELRARQYPHQLSGGMQQRVLIANAIALSPELIIADEPTSALDVTVQKRILDLLDDLQRDSGTAMILVTHDLGVAAERANRMLVMRAGQVEEDGPTAHIISEPSSAYAKALLANAPALTARPRDLDAEARVAASPPIVTVSELSRVFGHGKNEVRAVDSVSFAVPRGSTHAIVGESGSGKTTTVRMIMGFEHMSSGDVKVGDFDLARLSAKERRGFRRAIQLVYQNPFSSLDPRQSIGSIIEEPMRNFGLGNRAERRAAALELLDRVALPRSVATRPPRELSGGQRQRVAIARALAARPDVVVLDEAVSALDVTVQAQILNLLSELQKDLGLTYLFVSHDLAVVRDISNSVTVMQRGRAVETGATADVFNAPAEDYTKELLNAIPRPLSSSA